MDLTVAWGLNVGRWSVVTLLVSENRAQRQSHKKNLPSPSRIYSSLKTNTDHPTQRQHTGEGALPVSAWRDIMPQCQSDVQASMIGECEKNVRGRWVTAQIHAHTVQRTHRWCKVLCLRLQFLIDIILSSWLQILASGREGERGEESVGQWKGNKGRYIALRPDLYSSSTVCKVIDSLIPTMCMGDSW